MSVNPIQTRVVAVDPERPDPHSIRDAAAVLRRGGLVAFATETVYGLGAVATDPEAVARIFAAKGRPSFNPLIVHVEDVEQARRLVDAWPADAQRLADRFWPGPLTLVLPRSRMIPDIVTAGQATVAIRIPAPRVARDLIQAVGLPVAAPSANRSNRISPTRAEHVLADLDGRVDLILDSGPTAVGLESTVVDLTGDVPTILRPGPISAQMLEEALGYPVGSGKSKKPAESAGIASPGQHPVHYSPKTRAIRIEPTDSLAGVSFPGRIAVLELGSFRRTEGLEGSKLGSFGRIGDPEAGELGSFRRDGDGAGEYVRLQTVMGATRRLYEILHHFDDLAPDLIVVLMPPNLPEWSAVRDRLERATVPLIP